MRTFFNKNRVTFTPGVHQYTYQYQGTVFYSRCEHCTQYCKRKVTVFLQYFCHNVLHSRCCGEHCSLLSLFSTKERIDFDCFTSFFSHFMSTFCISWISHALTACKPWCCCTSSCSNNKRCSTNRRGSGLYCTVFSCVRVRVASLGFPLKMRCHGVSPTSLRRPIFFCF